MINESAMGDHNLDDDNMQTHNAFERIDDTTMKQLKNGNSYDRDDNFIHDINTKKDDDFDGGKVPITDFGIRDTFHPTDFARPQIEDLDKKSNFE